MSSMLSVPVRLSQTKISLTPGGQFGGPAGDLQQR